MNRDLKVEFQRGTAAGLELQAIRSLMEKANRADPIGEAVFSSLEVAALLLSCLEMPSDGRDRLELLRQAMGAARASVVAVGYALSSSLDVSRACRRVGSRE